MARQHGILTWLVTKYTDVREHKSLHIFGRLLDDPNLFHLNETSVPRAFGIGLFCAWIPLPLQMLVSVTAAIVLRANVPLAALLVWITNPITIPPMFYFAYVVGTWVTGEPAQLFEFQLSMEWLMLELGEIGVPLLIGSTILGIISGLIGYIGMRFYWNKRLARLMSIRVKRHMRYKKRHLDRVKKGKHGKHKRSADAVFFVRFFAL